MLLLLELVFAGGEYAGIGSGCGATEWYEGASETFLFGSIVSLIRGSRFGRVSSLSVRAGVRRQGHPPATELPRDSVVRLTVRRRSGSDRGCVKVLGGQRIGARGEEAWMLGDGSSHFCYGCLGGWE